MGKIAALLCAVLVVCLVACGAESKTVEVTPPVEATSAPLPTTDASVPSTCDEVDDPCLYLHFDGEVCTYEGPTEIKPGPVTLIFLNAIEGDAFMELAYANMVRHTGDETLQDMIDDIGEEPSTKHHPGWTTEIPGVWKGVDMGESHTWEGDLVSGIHTMVCVLGEPFGVYFGGGFEVKE